MFKRKLLAITDAGQEVFQHPDLKKFRIVFVCGRPMVRCC